MRGRVMRIKQLITRVERRKAFLEKKKKKKMRKVEVPNCSI